MEYRDEFSWYNRLAQKKLKEQLKVHFKQLKKYPQDWTHALEVYYQGVIKLKISQKHLKNQMRVHANWKLLKDVHILLDTVEQNKGSPQTIDNLEENISKGFPQTFDIIEEIKN